MNQLLTPHPEMVEFLAQGNTKPVVYYKDNIHQYIPKQIGEGAVVWPINHQNHLPSHKVSNNASCYTSPAIRIGENGEFETLNTIYKPTPIHETADTE